MTHTVSITSSGFVPQVLTIKQNDKVVWRNDCKDDHTVSFRYDQEKILPPTKMSEKEFPNCGTYKYACRKNTSFNGTITVA